MPSLQTFSVGPLSTNCYLLSQDSRAILIDPGDDGDFLSEQITKNNLTLDVILLTHGHFDHVLGLLPLHLNFPSVPIYLHKDDEFLYQRAVSSAKHWLGEGYSPDPPPEGLTLFTNQLPDLLTDHWQLTTIFSPGHTPGSVCFYIQEQGILFSGDTLFYHAVGRTDLSYSSPLKLAGSLSKLSELPPETLVYPGHGKPTTIEEEFANIGGPSENRTRA